MAKSHESGVDGKGRKESDSEGFLMFDDDFLSFSSRLLSDRERKLISSEGFLSDRERKLMFNDASLGFRTRFLSDSARLLSADARKLKIRDQL